MPMSPRLLRPRATGFHPEANSWRTRVIANGGSVSATTIAAVSKFCRDIDAAGLRDRFARLNLFCGSNLSACLVPLYLNTLPSGSTLGGSTDTNSNFVGGDYAETGATGGLLGNGSTKSLDTGLSVSSLPTITTGHLAAWKRAGSFASGGGRALIAVRSGSPLSVFRVHKNDTSGGDSMNGIWGKTTSVSIAPASVNDAGLQMVNRSSTTRMDLYWQGQSIANSTASITADSTANTFRVFQDAQAGEFFPLRICGYSIGQSMEATQALAYYTAMQAFQTALGRSA